MNKVKIGGPTVLFHGALAASLATFVGHYPWFATVCLLRGRESLALCGLIHLLAWNNKTYVRGYADPHITNTRCALQYNSLDASLPKYDELHKRLLRSAFMGWCSSFISDICSNSIRVIKTSKQSSTVPITYAEIVKVGQHDWRTRHRNWIQMMRIVRMCEDSCREPSRLDRTLIVQNIVAKEGIQGLFLRGLGTKLITNGIQVGIQA
jgi:hypothetical protein